MLDQAIEQSKTEGTPNMATRMMRLIRAETTDHCRMN
jgi:hypothetical protein